MKHAISRERLTLNKNTISMLSTSNEDKRNHVQISSHSLHSSRSAGNGLLIK